MRTYHLPAVDAGDPLTLVLPPQRSAYLLAPLSSSSLYDAIVLRCPATREQVIVLTIEAGRHAMPAHFYRDLDTKPRREWEREGDDMSEEPGEPKVTKVENPKFKEEEEAPDGVGTCAALQAFTEQVKMEVRFRQWEQHLIAERDRLNKDLEQAHSQIKALEIELDQMSGGPVRYGSAASRVTAGRR
ncbi:hypothetical protein JCM3770_006806 [Rhodotorula araucariae]